MREHGKKHEHDFSVQYSPTHVPVSPIKSVEQLQAQVNLVKSSKGYMEEVFELEY